jgi:hypothetical protein
MTDREAFEKWWETLPKTTGVNFIDKKATLFVWQAATKNQDALIAAAYQDAAKIAYEHCEGDVSQLNIEQLILSRTPADAEKKLDEMLMTVAEEVDGGSLFWGEDELRAIVDRVKRGE